MIVWHHDGTDWNSYSRRPCVRIPSIGSVPVGNPPTELGVYPDGGSDPVPEGERATGWERIVRDGQCVRVPTGTEAYDPEQEAAERIATERPSVLTSVGGVLQCIADADALGVTIPDPPTWPGIVQALLAHDTPEADRLWRIGRTYWDDVLFAVGGDPQAAYRYLQYWRAMIQEA